MAAPSPDRLRFSEAELLRSDDYARPHVEAGRRLHGGFDAEGRYVPPRMAVRSPAIDAWTESLRARGGDLLAADSSLLDGLRMPNEAQQKLLLQEGLGQTFWNTLTITGHIEARGRLLSDMTFPEFSDVLVEDTAEMGIGHLNRGLLKAHGIDEGGEPEKGIGGHDIMWFALRDLAFGAGAYPEPEVPDNIARPEEEIVFPEGIREGHVRTLYFLLNLLMIEFRAERGFRMTEAMLRDPELFTDRRAEAERAADIVGRIRADEEIHVRSLRLYLGELRQAHFDTPGGPVPGHEIVDPLWEGIVRWATVEQPKLQAEQTRKVLAERILAHADGARILAEFERLSD
ncbi:MAG: hypothetical protein QNK05_25735 [Myxococcota bacterium]|nr:hypothetical protein [Myxococcota bacterium]